MQGQISNARVHGRDQGGDNPYVSIATKYAGLEMVALHLG